MQTEVDKDVRRLWLTLGIGSGVLLLCLGWAAYHALWPQWKSIQQQATAYFGTNKIQIRQQQSCTGQIDRCTTCHVSINDNKQQKRQDIPHPFRSHEPSMAHHLHYDFGCSVCHGGTGRSLHRVGAHLAADQSSLDQRMAQPHIQASCVQCHLPGAVKGDQRLAQGAFLYAQLGCPVCHPLDKQGRGGQDYGPDLRTIGYKTVNYLQTSILNPSDNFPDSSMPTFASAFLDKTDSLTDLIIFVESLILPTTSTHDCAHKKPGITSQTKCSACHWGPAGHAQGEFEHKCTYLLTNADILRCKRCHSQLSSKNENPSTTDNCPVIQRHRTGCVVCHPL